MCYRGIKFLVTACSSNEWDACKAQQNRTSLQKNSHMMTCTNFEAVARVEDHSKPLLGDNRD